MHFQVVVRLTPVLLDSVDPWPQRRANPVSVGRPIENTERVVKHLMHVVQWIMSLWNEG